MKPRVNIKPSPAALPGARMAPACPWLLKLLLVAAGFWLIVGILLTVCSEAALLSPAILSALPLPGFGRLHILAATVIDYGFGAQAAMAISVWLLRTGRQSTPTGGPMSSIGWLFWNLGMMAAVLEIAAGHNTGIEGFELPRSATWLLGLGLSAIGACVFLTKPAAPSGEPTLGLRFSSLAIPWLGWILLTAVALLFAAPPRGIVLSGIGWWLQHNLRFIVFGFAGLGFVIHFFERHGLRFNKGLGVLALSSLALFGGFGGIAFDAPLPAWIVTLSAAGAMACVIPLLALALCLAEALRHPAPSLVKQAFTAKLCAAALLCWFISTVQMVLTAIPPISAITGFTLVDSAQNDLLTHGFLPLAILAVILDIFADPKASTPGRVRLLSITFACLLGGAVLSWISTAAAGVAQGLLFQNASIPAMDALQSIRPALIAGGIGKCFTLAGAVLVFVILLTFLRSQSVLSPASRAPGSPIPVTAAISFSPLVWTGLFLALLVSWGIFVAGPIFQLGGLQPTPIIGNASESHPQNRSGLALRGSEVYREQACATCHTQQIRPPTRGADLARGWGSRRTVPRDYLFDCPPFPGSRRIGPDLANVGGRLGVTALRQHLKNPRVASPKSIMPSYQFLFARNSNSPEISAGDALVAYLQSLKSGAILYETPTNLPSR